MTASFKPEAQIEPQPGRHRDSGSTPTSTAVPQSPSPVPSDRQRPAIPACLRPRSQLDGIPVEVIGMILQETVEEAKSNRDIHRLACVSKQLREIAFNLPRFWTRIIFTSPGISGFTSGPNFSDATWFLSKAPKRFRSSMLDIVIRDTPKKAFRYEEITNILRILRRFPQGRVGHWRSLSIEVILEDTLHDFFNLLAPAPPEDDDSLPWGRASLLPTSHEEWPSNVQSLELSCQSKSAIHLAPLPIFFEHGLPSLKRFSLKDLDIDWLHFSDQIEPNSLKQLSLEKVDVCQWSDSEVFFGLLGDATSLHTLTMIDMDLPSAESSRYAGCTLKNLRTLRLAWRTESYLTSTMKALGLFVTPDLSEFLVANLAVNERLQHNESTSDCLQRPLDRPQRGDIQPLIEAVSQWSQASTIARFFIQGVRVDPDLRASSPVDQFRDLLSAPSLRRVQTLFLRGTDKYLIEALFLGIDVKCMPSLRTVNLDEHAENSCQEFLCAYTPIRIDLQNVSLSLGSGKPIRFRGTPKASVPEMTRRVFQPPPCRESKTRQQRSHSPPLWGSS